MKEYKSWWVGIAAFKRVANVALVFVLEIID